MSELEILAQYLDGATTAAAWAVGAYVIAKWIFHTAIIAGALLLVVWWLREMVWAVINDCEKSKTPSEEEK